MVALLKLRRRAKRDAEPAQPQVEIKEPPAGSDRLLLLVPEGGFSFRVFAFSGLEPARDYLDAHAILRHKGTITFWALDSRPPADQPSPSGELAEATVMIRRPDRPDVVELYSFADMEAAQSYLRDAGAGGLDLGRALLYWAERVSLDEAPSEQPDRGRPRRQSGPAPPQADAGTSDRPAASAGSHSRQEHMVEARPDPSPAAVAQNPGEAAGATPGSSTAAGIMERINRWPGWDGLAPRVFAAALLKEDVYHDLRRDQYATGRARLIVGLGALAAGVGALGSGVPSALAHAIAFLLGWMAFAGTIYVAGTWVLGGRPEPFSRFLQAAGLAAGPAALLVFRAMPVYGPLITLAVSAWIAVAAATAAAVILELNRESALLTAAVGWCLLFAISQLAPAALA